MMQCELCLSNSYFVSTLCIEIVFNYEIMDHAENNFYTIGIRRIPAEETADKTLSCRTDDAEKWPIF